MPFIVFSVGVDNVFILLSAWRITNPSDTLVDRLSETFGDAAVSITGTDLFCSAFVDCRNVPCKKVIFESQTILLFQCSIQLNF
jgi:hypothetical protein